MQRDLREHRQRDVEVEANVLSTRVRPSTSEHPRLRPHVREPSRVPARISGRSNSSSGKNSLVRIASSAEQHGEEADRVDEETDADAREAEENPRHRRAEDPRRVEEARVERDRVRQRLAADHPVRQLLARRHVEHEDRAVDERDRVEHPRLRDAGERDPGERDRGHELAGLRPEHEAARVEPVGDHAGEEAEERERQELRERHDADRERSRRASAGGRTSRARSAASTSRSATWAGPRRRGGSCGSGGSRRCAVAAVVIGVLLVARRCESGSTAAPTAASSSGESVSRRLASQAVRRERTRRSVRWPSSVSVRPTRRRSASLCVRVTSPSRSSRTTRFDIAAVETRSSAASSPTVTPGAYLIATSRPTCCGETPAIFSRRSSRASWRSVGRRRSATAITSSRASPLCCIRNQVSENP